MRPSYSGNIGSPRQIRFFASFPALLTLVIGLITTAILFLSMHGHEQRLEDVSFERRANTLVLAVRSGLDNAVHALETVNQSFKTFAPVSREQFRAFTQPLLVRYPYIQNFSFHRIVSKAERPAFEAEMRKHYPDFSVTDIVHGKQVSAGVRDSYRVISYLHPMTGNKVVFGLDVAAFTSKQDDAIRRAVETGRASATGLFYLPQTAGAQLGFAVLMPVYRQNAASDIIKARWQAVIGYTLVICRAGDFVEKILTAADLLNVPNDISVYADALPEEHHLVFRKGSALPFGNNMSQLPDWLFRDRPHTLSRTFDVAGKTWHMVISAQSAPFADYHLGSLLALLGGTLFSFLTAGCIQKLALRSHRTQQLVDERTAELKVANKRLTEDIAARKQVEQTLRHTQYVLTSAQKVAHLGSWELDIKTGELHCSDEVFRICGLEPQSVKLDIPSFLGMVHPDDVETIRTAIAALREECKGFKNEKRVIRPDGSIRYITCQSEIIFNKGKDRHTVAGSFLDVTEQKQTEMALRQSQEKLRELAAHLERIKEDERKRIAREVHDDLGALLTGIKAYLSVAIDRATLAGTPPDELLVEAAKLADVATETVRRVVADLRPSVLDELGVWTALDWYVGQIEKQTELACQCIIDANAAATEVDPERSTMLFRIVQEALTNVVRHAEASRVTVRAMRQEDSIMVEIEDDGKGIDMEHLLDRESWGLVGMHERVRYFGGELQINGTPGRGTIVILRLPLEERDGW